MKSSCENCGSRSYDGLCVNCDEENYIEDQYVDLDIPVPDLIADTAAEQRARRHKKLEPYG